ncbi:MAG: phosphate/phosphite/phosphonate ABC transporter substrate-binding protein [Caldilineae bacterium]|nr:phosphate/phosphite/phosphonate ABC transporter substrate-binding protein [Caldilineae bacterium]
MRLMRWLSVMLLALSLGASLAACGGEPEEAGDGDAAGEMSDEGAADAEAGDDAAGDDAAAEEAGAAEGDATAGEAMAPGDLGTSENPIVMSFVPSGETEEVMTGSDEISKLLEAETGLSVKSNVATSYAAVIEAMGAGQAQVGWLNTFSYILANQKSGVKPILVVERFGSTAYASLIITRADSGIESLADLKGSKFCRPDPLSTSGWIIPSVDLAAAGLDPETDLEIVDSGNHDAVVTAVYNGDCDAGAVYDDARTGLEEEFPDVMEVVSVIHTSADIPNDNVSVTADLPEALAARLSAGLMAIGETEEGAAAFETAYGIEKLVPADDAFYDDFRATLDQAGVDVEDLAKE